MIQGFVNLFFGKWIVVGLSVEELNVLGFNFWRSDASICFAFVKIEVSNMIWNSIICGHLGSPLSSEENSIQDRIFFSFEYTHTHVSPLSKIVSSYVCCLRLFELFQVMSTEFEWKIIHYFRLSLHTHSSCFFFGHGWSI